MAVELAGLGHVICRLEPFVDRSETLRSEICFLAINDLEIIRIRLRKGHDVFVETTSTVPETRLLQCAVKLPPIQVVRNQAIQRRSDQPSEFSRHNKQRCDRLDLDRKPKIKKAEV